MLQTNRVLQKEQAELFAIQKKLDRVLPVIQEALNSLKVEELHLKSQVVGQQNSKTECTPARDSLHIDLTMEQSPITTVMESHLINSQQIDLDFTSQISRFEEEVDSD
ncbi:uncharacterized protein LOC6553268 [Drosophila erecta]|uniref:GG20234 n=1 Tax=Drosophila erecta TaxID=7220 RepID=B3P3X9_DROER|nr:uncharacterized protein LOC6553268 [Drosophila erecta]EDV49085.1 uncharacterized protein Dere_GG20234 [Drosophila erecta]